MFTYEDHRAAATEFVALARAQASEQRRWYYMGEARTHHIAANNMQYTARLSGKVL